MKKIEKEQYNETLVNTLDAICKFLVSYPEVSTPLPPRNHSHPQIIIADLTNN